MQVTKVYIPGWDVVWSVQELGDEVAGQILELAEAVYSPTAWHGACLALAELAR